MSITVTTVTGPTLVQSGNTTFYKYEPFEYTFTDGANTLTVSTQNFATYFSGSGSTTVTFSAPIKGFTTTGSQSGDTFTITSSGGTTSTFTIFVLSGRFQGSNAITAYIGETLSSTYTSVPSLTDAYPSPTLPTGLSFSLNTSNTLVVSGTPTAISPVTSYLLYGSNSTNGYTVSELVSIQICNARVVVTPAAPPTQYLTVGTLFAGLTLSNAISLTDSLTFAGSLPLGLSFVPSSGNSTTITGTPLANSASVFNALCTIRNSANTAFTIVTIPFVYNEYVSFTNSLQTYQLYSNISVSDTLGSNIQLTAVTSNASSAIVSYTSNQPIPGLTLDTPSGILSGAPTAGGNVTFTATNSNSKSGTSPQFTFNVSQAGFTSSNVPSSVSGYVGKAISSFTFTVSTAAYSTFPSTSRTITGVPSGLAVLGSGQTFTLSGIPTTAGTTTSTIIVNAANVTPLTISIPFTISPDTYTVTPATQTFAFAQNLPITPIQVVATPTFGTPVNFYSGINLPLGLSVSSTGLIQGTPLGSGSGSFTINFTNGYSPSSVTYSYTTVVDTMIIYSSKGNLFPLSPGQAISIPLTAVLRSGAPLTSGLTSGYLYGLTLTPTLLSGTFVAAVYPDVVLPASTLITINGSNANGDISSTFFTLTAGNVQVSINPNIVVGGRVKYFSGGVNSDADITIPDTGITDFQCAIPGGAEFMIVDDRKTWLSINGGLNYTEYADPVYSVAFCGTSWYGLKDSSIIVRWEEGEGGWQNYSSPLPISARASDGGLILRAVTSSSSSQLLLGGTALAYYSLDVSSLSISIPPSKALQEIRDISTNVPSMIVVAGGYRNNIPPTISYSTLQYSTDYGVTLNLSTNDFTWYATNVVWGGYINQTGTTSVWIALGRNINNIPGIKFSTDGMTWKDIVGVGGTYTSGTILGPLQFDGTNWNLLVDNLAWTHDVKSDTLTSINQWRRKISMDNIAFFCPTPYFDSTEPSNITLNIGITGSGPVFSSPTTTSYLGYQYVPISTIIFDTVADGTSFFLASTLPAGLAWSPAAVNTNGHVCATISGRPVILGTSVIDVYAQNTTGISKITVTIITQPIPLKTPDTTPSGYTNFIKQKVIADSAVSSINNKALVSPVGTFLAKDPQPETTAPATCCPITQ